MRTLTYAGVDFAEFKCWWDGSQVFRKPNKIINRHQIPYRNGDLIRSTEAFENVEISFNCFIKEDYEENYSNLVNYLNSFDSYQRLETSAEPSIYRMAMLHAVIEPETGQFLKDGRFTITFDCMPQEWLKSGENEMSIDMQTTTYTDPVEVDIEYDDALVDNAVLTLSPVQDLNGQAYPWIDRVGRNKLNLVNMAKTETVNGITFTLTDEGKIYMNGTQDGSTTMTMWFPFASIETIPNGIWKINGLPSNMTFGDYGFSVFKNNDLSPTELYENNSEVTGTITNFGVWVYEGVTVNNVELKPMVRESTDTSDVWQPYERTTNICPIYPSNGKNLLNATGTNTYCTLENGMYTLDSLPSSNQNFVINTVSLLPGEYIISGGYDNNFQININIGGTYYTSKGDEVTFHVDTSGNYTVQCIILTTAIANTKIKPMIRLSSESSDFVPYQSVAVQQTGEPYTGNTYTSDLEQFVYGGTVDLVTGVLTVGWKLVDLGSLTWTYNGARTRFEATLSDAKPTASNTQVTSAISSGYRAVSASSVTTTDGAFGITNVSTLLLHDDRFTTVADFVTAVTGQTICYELASPVNYYLSAQDVSLLQGKNYFTAEQPLSVTITEGTTLTNPSYMKARPIIKLNNTGTGTVKLNNEVVVRLTEAPSNVPIYIDCENMNCYSYDSEGNVVNENGNVTLPEGYIEMEKGNNRFTATGQLEPTMIPRWWRL